LRCLSHHFRSELLCVYGIFQKPLGGVEEPPDDTCVLCVFSGFSQEPPGGYEDLPNNTFYLAIFCVLVDSVIYMVLAKFLMYFRMGDGVKLMRNVTVVINLTMEYVYQNEWFMIWLERGASMRCGFYHVL